MLQSKDEVFRGVDHIANLPAYVSCHNSGGGPLFGCDSTFLKGLTGKDYQQLPFSLEFPH